MDVAFDPIPFALTAAGPTPEAWEVDGGTVTIWAPAGSDLFIDPALPGTDPTSDAPRLLGQPVGDFQLSARVTVDFRSQFDAGVLIVWVDEHHWAKLCFEFTPQSKPSVVTVITRGESDDANSFELEQNTIWLRMSRIGATYVCHASTDGQWWRLIRYFTLGAPDDARPALVGFEGQAPTGDGCLVTFDEVAFVPETLRETRDGS
jgi:regulation of enolase protein 1 (concanavalin A-like superfamily)